MNTEELSTEESRDYSFEYACVIKVPIIFEVPLSVRPTVIANKPVCRQNYNGYMHYEEKEKLVEASC